jgi:carbon monoxide dehydrogenase subunit G
MPKTRRSRTVSAAPDDVWPTVADPHHLPRWWPGVERVEGVDESFFTEVLRTDHGKTVRADFRVAERREPEVCCWTQELDGTPFERIFAAARTEVRLQPDGGGTRVTIEEHLTLRGMARFGGFMVRRARGKRLDEALDGLAALHGTGTL